MELLTVKYNNQLSGVLKCYDRIVVSGTLPELCFSQGMTSYLYKRGIKIFDYPRFAEPFKERLRSNAEQIAKENGIEIEYVAKSHIRKEDLVGKVLKERGYGAGLVHILSAMEACPSYKPWHDKRTGKTFLKGTQSKCLHYYFYLIDPYLGLVYVRVPTWCPFRLQVYFNGHNILKNQLDREGVAYTMLDNAFDSIEVLPDGTSGWEKAQGLADQIDVGAIHERLDEFAQTYCPVYKDFGQVYHWSIMQAEYATDIVFAKQSDLAAIYEDLIATAIHTVKPGNIATFLGQKLDPRYEGQVGNNYNIRIEGSRIKHNMGSNSIKMYDKFNKILRIETTTNNVSFFKHFRQVEHRDGTSSRKMAGMKKNIYSLAALQENLRASNQRYLEFVSAIEDKRHGRKRLEKVSRPISNNNRHYKGFNFFSSQDTLLLLSLLRGEFNITGFQNKHLRKLLSGLNSGQISRLIKRLHVHGLIKKVAKTYKYYLTKLGKEVLATAEKVKEMVIIPALNY